MTVGAVGVPPGLPPGTATPALLPVGGGRTYAAVAVALASWVPAVAAVLLLALARPGVDQDLLFFLVDLSVACLYGTLAAVVLARRTHPVSWLLALAGVGGGLAAFGFAYDAWAAAPGGLSPSAVLAALGWTAWVPGTLALFLVVPWLVRDHPLGHERWGVAIGAVLCLGFLPASMTAPPLVRGAPLWVPPALHLASQAVLPASVLVVVLRNRLWGLDLAVSRVVLAGLLTTVLLVLYLVVTAVVTRVLPGEGAVQLVGAGVVAAATTTARSRAGWCSAPRPCATTSPTCSPR